METVRDYYDRRAEDEWDRLKQDAFHHLEFRATMACLRAHLPPVGLVLDAGGGPGRYTRELCRMGYEVVLLDLSARCLAVARKKLAAEDKAVAARLFRSEVGDVRDLSRFTDGTFDAVLCLGGPLSHMLPAADRQTALSELVRVAAPGAPVIISVIGYYAVLRTVLTQCPVELADPEKRSFLTTGDHFSTGGFPDTHFFRPEELQAAAEVAGLRTVEMRACEGLSANLAEATNALQEQNDGRWEEWLRILDATAHDPAVIATCEHFLYAGRTPGVSIHGEDNTMQVALRPLTHADAPAIAALAESLPQWFNRDVPDEACADAARCPGVVAVGEDGAFLGLVIWEHLETDTDIKWIMVAPRLHRQGIGRKLMTHVITEAEAAGRARLVVSTLAATVDYEPYARSRAFYESLGFTLERVEPAGWPDGTDKATYARKL